MLIKVIFNFYTLRRLLVYEYVLQYILHYTQGRHDLEAKEALPQAPPPRK